MNEEDFWNFVKDFMDYLNTQEQAIKELKEQIAKLVGIAEKQKWNWNPEAIKWREAEGFRGKYQRYPLEGEKAEASPDYRLLLEDLKKHGGRLTRNGWFYWLFEDNATVGRKPRKAKTPKEA